MTVKKARAIAGLMLTGGICFIIFGGIITLLGGCASTPKAPIQPVKITGSDFCRIVRRKLVWSVEDTRETIQQVRIFNRKHDARCRK